MHKTKEQLQKYSPLFTHYTELRVQENTNISVSMLNGDVQQNSKATTSGSSARVFKNGVWGFASTPQITDEDIEDIINDATQNAVFMYEKQQASAQDSKVSALPKEKTSSVNDFSTKKKKATQKELLDFLGKLDNYIATKYEDVTSRTLYLGSLDVRKSLYTSDDSYFFSMVPRTILYINLAMTHKEDGSTIELYDVLGGLGEFPDVFENAQELFPQIDTIYSHLQDKTQGIYPDAGIKECIIDADVAGILAHEAIGHTTEADLVQGGSIAGEFMNKEVGSELVNIVDFAHTFNDEICPVPVFVDDEGTPSEDTIIIENGVLKNYMHNKESAVTFKASPTGNARASTFLDEPLIRMRNTAFLPGKSKLEDMIKSIDDGYYLMKSSNGQADSTSEFMFGIVLAYEIKNGKLGRALKDFTISGVAFDVLKTVTMVSEDMSWSCGGMCGKKQSITVGMGGPAIKCKINIGGK